MLQVTGLARAFRDPDGSLTPIIDIPSFAVLPGEQVAIRGASGSGKTTFLNLIAGILKADRGEILVDGHNLTVLPESARDRLRARTMGYVFQNFNLLQGYTALENVMLGMLFGVGVDAGRAKALLERVGLGHRLHHRPVQLSLGQQQRVAVARALANHPMLVLADEPTGNLDQHHSAEAIELIREVCREQNAALLLVSHDPAVVERFSRVEDLLEFNHAATGHSAPPAVPA
ncbi:MAG: ABC transporter ATP-binding protein [Gemmatimonadetes bacterium]|nr:ABC transporter ATP-binding protein [Gemmatimonadota bacterium]